MTDKNRTILVVDDEPMVLEITSKTLERVGYCVLTAISGSRALELCRNQKEPIDLLLTDIQMPNMSGVELARCIAHHKLAVPILFMTGFAENSELKELLTSRPNMDGHSVIQKPFRAAALVERIDEMIAQSAFNKEASSS